MCVVSKSKEYSLVVGVKELEKVNSYRYLKATKQSQNRKIV